MPVFSIYILEIRKSFITIVTKITIIMYKTCAICGRKVYRGTGTYYGGRLVHRSCLGIAKIQRYKLYGRRKKRVKERRK